MQNLQLISEFTETKIVFFKEPDFSTLPNDSIVVFDTNTKKLFSKYFPKTEQFTFNAGEMYKNSTTVKDILEFAIQKNATRNTTFVAVGGGVVSDITAFCTSIYKRGAKLVLVPTTLLAMVDASIGGKTGFDFYGIKNAIGSFFTAQNIFICFNFLKPLPEYEYKNGLAEILKIGIISEKKILALLEESPKELFFKVTDPLKKIIYLAIKAKLKIVKTDFTEKNSRRLLNLGHTFAHALESLFAFSGISHGEAVGWGISQAVKISSILKICDKTYVKKIQLLLKKYNYKTLFYDDEILDKLSLTKNEFRKKLVEFMLNDKKNTDARIVLILPKKSCKNIIYPIEKKHLIHLFKQFD